MSVRWLCIETHFLAGRYHGRRGKKHHQWPPNPHRLFQALVAAGNMGFHRKNFCDEKKEALRWLETQPNPEIIAPETRKSPRVKLYGPNNDADKEIPEGESITRAEKLLCPHTLIGDATVRFLWQIKEEDWKSAYSHIEIICAESRRLHSLGLGIDLVAGNGRVISEAEKRGIPGEVWLADENGSGWRVPTAGSLDEILDCHAQQSKRVQKDYVIPPVPPRKCSEVSYIRRAEGWFRRVHAFKLVNEDGQYRPFNPRRVMEVAAWLRHAAHKKARDLKTDPNFIENFICGHGKNIEEKNKRLSYLPLPTIPAKGRDGGIRRVLLVTPFNYSRGKEERIISSLDGMSLVSEKKEFMADLQTLPREDRMVKRYLIKSKRWGSVTPVVLPGHDDYRLRKARGLILKSLKQAGYTTPIEEICLRNGPIFPGAEMAHTYRVPAYLKGFTLIHVVLTFSDEVPGPVVIGAGRHIGLGTFSRLDD